jgi:hypothetical protein
MADFRQNKKDAESYYETQQKIAEVIKEQTDTWSSYTNAQKQGVKNAKEMRQIQKEIAKLANATTAEEVAKKAELEKQLEYLKEYNKQLISIKTGIKAAGKSLASWGMDSLVGQATKLLSIYDNIDASARKAAITQGMSVTRMETMRNIAHDTEKSMASLGFDAGFAGEMMSSFADETGRQVMMSQQSLETLTKISKRTGISHQEMAGLAGQMEAFGMGAEGSANTIKSIEDMSNKMGVNTQKVIKKVQQNLKLVNKLNFKGGVKGMARMAASAEKYKISMESVAGFADKVFRPEGAIEAAANLQVLGGGLAKLGDPFKLMSQARNDPEAFAESLIQSAGGIAQLNKETGEFVVNGMQLDRLKEVSSITGESLDELVGRSKQLAKVNMFEDALKFDPKSEDGQFLSSIMDMDAKGGFVIDAKGDKKHLKDLSASQQQSLAKELKDKKAADEEREKAIQSTQERIRNKLYEILMQFEDTFKSLDDALRGPILKVLDYFVVVIQKPWVKKLIAGLAIFSVAAKFLGPILSPIGWYLRGRMMSIGFNKGLKQQKVVDTITGGKQGPLTKSGKPDMRYKANKGMGGAGKGAAGTKAMGQSAGGQASNFLQGAVALLAISAALFVFAKALQEFEKLQNGWGTLVLAGASLIVLGVSLKIIGPILNRFGTNALPGIGAMLALSLAVNALGVATMFFAQGGVMGTVLMVGALIALAFAVTMFGGLSLSGVGWAGIGLILAMGVAMIMVGAAVLIASIGISMIVDSFTNMFSIINMENIGALLMLGPALIGVSIGVFALALSLVALGVAYLAGGFLGIFALGETADKIQTAFGDVDAGEVASAITAINNVDMNKVAAIKDLANAMSMWSMFGSGIEINFSDLDVSGNIELKGGGKSAEMIMEEPYLTQLKDLIWDTMEKGKGGGKL